MRYCAYLESHCRDGCWTNHGFLTRESVFPSRWFALKAGLTCRSPDYSTTEDAKGRTQWFLHKSPLETSLLVTSLKLTSDQPGEPSLGCFPCVPPLGLDVFSLSTFTPDLTVLPPFPHLFISKPTQSDPPQHPRTSPAKPFAFTFGFSGSVQCARLCGPVSGSICSSMDPRWGCVSTWPQRIGG